MQGEENTGFPPGASEPEDVGLCNEAVQVRGKIMYTKKSKHKKKYTKTTKTPKKSIKTKKQKNKTIL